MTTNPFAHLRNITWFPGHMATTAREMREKIKFVGTIIEVRDARVKQFEFPILIETRVFDQIPISSSNPLLNEIIGNRQRVVAINKTDLVDKHSLKVSEKKMTFFYPERKTILVDGQLLLEHKRTWKDILQMQKQKYFSPKKKIRRAFCQSFPISRIS